MRIHSPKRQIPLVLLALTGGMAAGQPQPQERHSPVVPFEELFAVEDTIRLDPAVLLGDFEFMDVNEAGELLIDDNTDGGIHLFSPSGDHVRSFAVSNCVPGETDTYTDGTQFIGDGRILTVRDGRIAVIFGRDGSCTAATRDLGRPYNSFCDDGLIAAYGIGDEGSAQLVSYSHALEPIDTLRKEPSPFPFLNRGWLGFGGRDIACFDDGVYHVYRESFDAWRISLPATGIRYRPEFADERTRDVPWGHPNQSSRLMEVPMNLGIFALDHTTRMTVFTYLGEKWISGNQEEPVFGLSVASNLGLFPGRSTVGSIYFRAVGDGYVYALGNPDELPNGEFGNPVVVRYRFVPPARSSN